MGFDLLMAMFSSVFLFNFTPKPTYPKKFMVFELVKSHLSNFRMLKSTPILPDMNTFLVPIYFLAVARISSLGVE
jgi:hypothetical protein